MSPCIQQYDIYDMMITFILIISTRKLPKKFSKKSIIDFVIIDVILLLSFMLLFGYHYC